MGELVLVVIFRTITSLIGQYIRYWFYKMIGKKKSLKSLSNESKDEYKDLGKALKQNFYNTIIGTFVLFIFIIIIMAILYN